MKLFMELFGWYGTLALLAAYALVSFEIISVASTAFQVLNFSGAIAIASISFYKRTYQPAILNVIWAIVAYVALFRLL